MTADSPESTPERGPGDVVEVEVERLPSEEERRLEAGKKAAKRVGKRLLTVLSSFAIDVVDFATFGPLSILGLPLGALAGWWLSGRLNYPTRLRVWVALGAGVYCLVPPTSLIPVAGLMALIALVFPERDMEDRRQE